MFSLLVEVVGAPYEIKYCLEDLRSWFLDTQISTFFWKR